MTTHKAVFFVQYRQRGTSCRGIRSGGIIISAYDLCDQQFMSKVLAEGCKIMYQVNKDEGLLPLKNMRLDLFEQTFKGYMSHIAYLLNVPSSECIFRKEIQVKYGGCT